MTQNLKLFLVFLILIFLSCQKTDQKSKTLSDGDIESIKSTIHSHVQAGLKGDFDSFFAQFTDDAVWMKPNIPVWEGLETIRSQQWVRAIEWEISPIEIYGRDDLAYMRGSYKLLLDFEGATKDNGKILLILRKQHSGSWLISVVIFNSDLPLS